MTAADIDLLLARREAESEMRDKCIIVDPAGSKTWNAATLQYDVTPLTIYTGKCKVRFGKVGVRQGEQAGQIFIDQDATLSLPMTAPGSAGVRKDHVATITESATDDALVGVVLKVGAARRQSNATSRRFPVEETQ
ncbi:DUF6093 family protein [Agromyces aureus]|uniref:Uncharacterized protein n=1 Tax=Agromyces aureus TaxID=453304 RepID=A0A191WEX9_9MICO|nr:DUF6093 family protein [Agromyces aureus]ANJ26816.1 hypothetical protein ATC03_08890 [Agromyces aureus]